MNEQNDFALVPKPPRVIAKADSGAKGILADMLADILTQAPGEDPESSYQKARAYLLGDGVSQDSVEAVKWYRRAAEQGHTGAQFDLGDMYEFGIGVPRDRAEGEKWLRRAAEKGHATAQYELGTYHANGLREIRDSVEAVKWFRMAAEQGHRFAQYQLGHMYAMGGGVNQNAIEAAKWLRRVTEHRDINQDYDYHFGRKPTETVEWYRKAAEKGNASAQNNLGVIYANGIGVAQNRTEAEKWYRKAAEQGYLDAQFYLGEMYANGDGVPVNNEEAVKWFRKAALRFHSGALPRLGLKFYYGEGVQKCEIEGLAWFIYKTGVGRDTFGHEDDMKTRTSMEAALGPEKTLVAKKRSREIQNERLAARGFG